MTAAATRDYMLAWYWRGTVLVQQAWEETDASGAVVYINHCDGVDEFEVDDDYTDLDAALREHGWVRSNDWEHTDDQLVAEVVKA